MSIQQQNKQAQQQQQIIDYLIQHPVFGPYARRSWEIDPLSWPYPTPPVLPTIEEVVQATIEDDGFRALKLGNWLGTTDGRIIAEAVGFVIPPEYSAAYNLAVEGLTLAAELQRDQGRQTAAAVALFAFVGAILLAASEA